jgi:hypothetical protein
MGYGKNMVDKEKTMKLISGRKAAQLATKI